MPAPPELLELVERFRRNLDAYKADEYKEARVRQEFIDPLLRLLGWDLENKQGLAERFKEVIFEDALRAGGSVWAPDYCLCIGGTRTFYLEAKKPSVNIKEDTAAAFQLRRYAWSAKLPLSILTSFEGFAVYDCRVKPHKNDKASTARIMYLSFEEYSARWDEVSSRFSKEAVQTGSFDRYAGTAKTKRGTATVDDAFLEEIEGWRDALARNVALRNPGLSDRDLNFAIQAVIDRLVFLRICEDRGIENYGRLQGLLNGERVYRRLVELFREADDRYNSGLFHFRQEKDRPEPDAVTTRLEVDDKVLKDILRNLYYPDSPYEFSVLPADILGQVYERFLGKVIHLTEGHHARVEEKPEVRKAGGVYYTPTYIVDYIVRHTVGALLEGQTPKEAAKLRIVDPACGSGSFLIGAYQHLLDWHCDWYEKDGPDEWSRGKGAPLCKSKGGGWRLTPAARKAILLNNIHGVDIDPQAVEVTKLSLLLKVLEDETGETLNNLRLVYSERALPDLDRNIRCGNSLIGNDFYQGRQNGLFGDEEIREQVNAFDWDGKEGFPEIIKDGGFDAVIGNPPYAIIDRTTYPKEVLDYLNRFMVAEYKTDLFHLFIQKAVDLLRSGGGLGYIVPSQWFTLQHAQRLRKYVLDQTRIREAVVFSHFVFDEATVHTALLVCQKGQPDTGWQVAVRRPGPVPARQEIEESAIRRIPQKLWAEAEGNRFETRLVGEFGAVVNRVRTSFPQLASVARASLGCQAYNRTKHTAKQIAERVFHAERKEGKEYLPELAGNDVSRYCIERKRGKWIRYGPWLHDYRTRDWISGPRILVREITGPMPYAIQASYTEKTYCNYKTVLNVNWSARTTFSMKYLLGLLNSRLMSFLYPRLSNKMVAEAFPRLSVADLRGLPIRSIDPLDRADKASHDKMVSLVEKMLDLHKKLHAAKNPRDRESLQRLIGATDRQIDRLVYDLYGLTEEEIGIVEGMGEGVKG